MAEDIRTTLIAEIEAANLESPEQVADMVLEAAAAGGIEAGRAELAKCVANDSLKVGDRVEAGEGDDYDTGRIGAIDGDMATVQWDSHVVTQSPLSTLSRR